MVGAVLAPRWLLGCAFALGGGVLLPWVFARYFYDTPPAGVMASPSGCIAASFLINLAVVSVALASPPAPGAAGAAGWPSARALLRCALLALAAFVGCVFAPASPLTWKTALTLAAVTTAQAAALCGFAGLLSWTLGRFQSSARMLPVAVLALSSAGLLWTEPFLKVLYQNHPKWGTAAAETTLVLGPSTGLAAAWNESAARFDLVRYGPRTYDRWLGNNLEWSYPSLWPERQPLLDAEPGATVLIPGLVVGLFAWGALLTVLCDVLAYAGNDPKSGAAPAAISMARTAV